MQGGSQAPGWGAGSCCGSALMLALRVTRVEFVFLCISVGSAQRENYTSLPKGQQQRLLGETAAGEARGTI